MSRPGSQAAVYEEAVKQRGVQGATAWDPASGTYKSCDLGAASPLSASVSSDVKGDDSSA